MAKIEDLKELQTPETPLFLVQCTLTSGDVHYWSTHNVTVSGNHYLSRILKHNLFELRSSSNEATDGISRVSLTLANADSLYSGIERSVGWKGARVEIQFLFYDLQNAIPASDLQVLFNGTANPPDESTESYLRLSFTNRLSLQRIFLPEVRIQKRCPWMFPTSTVQLTEAVDGGAKGPFSPFYRCGYSAGLPNGIGNLSSAGPFTSCDYTRSQCQQRGMFDTDSSGNVTRRFGGVEFVPSSILVRPYGAKSSQLSLTLDNEARYNDYVPLIYGTGWYTPPIVFARNDGNLTHAELLLGVGQMTAVVKVIVNGIEIPEGVSGANMTATGWYNVVTLGARSGAFNLDFVDSNKLPLGDPYGSMASLSVVVPNQVSNGVSLPQIQVLAQGMQLSRFDPAGAPLDVTFTNNPAWVLLDVLRRSGWTLGEVDVPSFANAATACDQLVTALDLNGTPIPTPRYQCNLLLTDKRSAGDIVRGIRTGAGLYLTFGPSGLLRVTLEDALAQQQPSKPNGSNSTESLESGWPAYEFGDNEFSGIVRNDNGQSSFRTYTRATADSPNLFTVEFQDEFNEFQQDSLTLVDVDDALHSSQVAVSLPALGIPNFDQATRVTWLQLNKSIYGNMYVDFNTSVRAIDLRPGDIITLTYAKEGWDRQPFRITRIAPGANYRTAAISAQIHDDAWYQASGQGSTGAGRQAGSEIRLPRPLLGAVLDADGNAQFSVQETTLQSTDGTVAVQLAVGFVNPTTVTAAGNGLPLVGLNPQIQTTGGTLSGGQNLYYAVTAVDAVGGESALSFIVKATLPAGTTTNSVTLPTLSFPSTAESFNIYRGTNPSQLFRIAFNLPIAPAYTDVGDTASLAGPPDANYDHSNFYWRLELQPEERVDIHSPLTVGNSALGMLPNELTGATARILNGTGSGQERSIAGNTSTTITVTAPWTIEPDATSTFVVSDSSWQFGATGTTSPITFDVPNRSGNTVQLSGRSANVRNEECSYQLSPITRWQIQGDGGVLLDNDVPPVPEFSLSAIGHGTIEVPGISFSTYDDTQSIAAGTLTIGYWNELNTPSGLSLASPVDAATTTITLQAAAAVSAGDLIQIDLEIMVAGSVPSTGAIIQVTRASYGSAAAVHSTGTAVYLLEKKVFVMPFATKFFGSPASGSYAYPAYLPDVRIATAELFMTNSKGNSDVGRISLTGLGSQGVRTLSGGQLSIQVEGLLSIQSNAAPPLAVEETHAVRDIFANIGTPPAGSPVQLRLTRNSQAFCNLTIPVGSTISNVVDGFALGALTEKSLIGLDIVSLTQSSADMPGSNLTVTIRL